MHPLGRHLLECLSAQLTLPLDGFCLHGEVATLDVDPSGSAVPAKDLHTPSRESHNNLSCILVKALTISHSV